MRGFTLIEILLVLAIFAILLISSVVVLGGLRDDSDLQEEARGLQRVLEFARNRAIASEGDIKYGVYMDIAASPHVYVLFQTNTNYAGRVVSEDEIYQLRDTIEFGPVSFGGYEEVVFGRIQGVPNKTGSAQLRIKSDPSVTRTVYVESSGAVEIDTTAPVNDNDRVKDTRHMHVNYNGRAIDTATETIVLNFDSGVKIETIVIADHLSGGQIVWEGTIDVAGEPQTIKVHTHILNSASDDSKFCVHRDRRFNTKAVTVDISGDIGTLIEYDAAGNVTDGTAAPALNPVAQ